MGDHHVCSDAGYLPNRDDSELIPHLVRALARGRPVSVEEVAASAGRPVVRVERLVGSQVGTDWDEEGRLVGFGLTLRPTAHHFTIEGETLYTLCATDTLMFTLILGCSTTVQSPCPATGEIVTLELDPGAVVSSIPEEAVVSQRRHGDRLADVRGEVCDHGHFFASPEAAGTWLAEHPDGEVLRIAEAFDRCRSACEMLGWIPA